VGLQPPVVTSENDALQHRNGVSS